MAEDQSNTAVVKVEANVKEEVEAKTDVAEGTDRKTYSGKCFKDVEHFVNKDDQYLFCKTWKPKENPKALLLILHGYSEHIGWFEEIAENVVKLGILVSAFDYVGHGESEGIRCDVDSYEVYLRDALQYISKMKSEYPDLPLYIFGHSLGGGLTTILAGENPDICKGIILSAPLIISNILPTGAKLFFMTIGSLMVPRMEVLTFEPTALTRNAEEVKSYKDDSLIYHGKVRMRMLVEFVRLTKRARELLAEISVSVLVQQGDKDALCCKSGPEELMKVAKSEDKTLKLYEGVLHELLHEIDDVPQKFLNDIKEWLQKRISE